MVVGNIQHLTLNISKRIPFAFQNDPFCTPKRVLLHTKRSPFALQNESFYKPKGALLQCKRTPFEIRLLQDVIS